ncbi:glycosyl hydrolase [Massilioclostridium coli]|uniref:glycosyl hydrolase n=1 Tax=Massilioclostridium coli TaxID=1870991 RepID=UPI00085C30DF|nr:glycosyl hydrolase [Massilioclostridium coli]
MKRKSKTTGRKMIAVLTSAALLASVGATTVTALESTAVQKGSIIHEFKNPEENSKPMVRYWLPDAAADPEIVADEITSMYEAGYRGVEIAMVPRYSVFDPSEYGFGTEAWRNLLKTIFKTAKSFPTEFRVDLTSTPMWPVSSNMIDPNDDGASKELAHSYTKITQSGITDLPMPETRVLDSMRCPFVFTDDFLAATVAQVESVDADGNFVLKEDSMKDVSDAVVKLEKTTPAGVPDMNDAYMQQIYDGVTMDLEGGRSTEEQKNQPVTNENIEYVFGDRDRMADTQNYYSIDTSKLGIDLSQINQGGQVQAGDWLLFGFYTRGSGYALGTDSKVVSGGAVIYPINACQENVPYVVDHFSDTGANVTKELWDKYILCDEELAQLIREADCSIFEDSIEILSASPFWSTKYQEYFKQDAGYDLTRYLPYITSAKTCSTDKVSGYDPTKFYGTNSSRYIEDYFTVLSNMYQNLFVGSMLDWCHNDLDALYRTQAYITKGISVDTGAVSLDLDITEGESLAWKTNYDKFRILSGATHIAGKKYVTDEVLATSRGTSIKDNYPYGASYAISWDKAVEKLNDNWVLGVNLMMMHGAAYAEAHTFTSDGTDRLDTQWPGWHPFGANAADPWTNRQPYFEDVNVMTQYMAASQAILQNGLPKMDVLLYAPKTIDSGDDGSTCEIYDQSVLVDALDQGYTYDIVGEAGILHENAVVENKTLVANGPEYKAMVVYNTDTIGVEAAQQMLNFAKQGLPIIFVGGTPARVSGVSADSINSGAVVDGDKIDSDAEVQAIMAEITSFDNVAVIQDVPGVLTQLEQFGISSRVSYPSTQDLRSYCRYDETDGTYYYYFYNGSRDQKSISVPVTMTGEGAPYKLDAWTGEISPIAWYNQSGNQTTTQLDLEYNESAIIAISKNEAEFGAAPKVHVTNTTADNAVVEGNDIVARSEAKSAVTAELSNGSNISCELNPMEEMTLKNWDIAVESWGPSADPNAPATQSDKTTVNFANTGLISWKNLPATAEQLATLGVESMSYVSGIGHYSTSFQIDSLEEGQGAYLNFEHGNDEVTEIIVNGHDLGGINQSKNIVDIGQYLKEGKNTISIKLATPLNNRIQVENPVFQERYEQGYVQDYGLTAVSLVPYDEAVIYTATENGGTNGGNGTSSEGNVQTGDASTIGILAALGAAGVTAYIIRRKRNHNS